MARFRINAMPAARLNDAWPTAHMVHLPVHASWLNQVEIYFSAVQRKALVPDDFLDLDEVEQRLLSCRVARGDLAPGLPQNGT